MSRPASVRPATYSIAKHRGNQTRREESLSISWQASLSNVRDVAGTLLLVSPIFIGLKALLLSGFNLEVAVALVSSLTVASYLQVVSIYAVPALLLVAAIYCFLRAGVMPKTHAEAVIVLAIAAFITFSMFALVFALPYHRVFRAACITVGIAGLVLLFGVIVSMLLREWSIAGTLSIELLGWLCLLVIWLALSPDSARVAAFLPVAMVLLARKLASRPQMKSRATMISRVLILVLAVASLTSGMWFQPERMTIRGSEVTAYEVRADADAITLFIRNRRSLERVSRDEIANRQFCRHRTGTVAESAINAGRSMPDCPT
jgi:hypothetical protein